jgi:PAS domain S-box-containing protein
MMNEFEELQKIKKELHDLKQRLNKTSSLTSDFSYSVSLETDGDYVLEWTFGAYEAISGFKFSEDLTNDQLIKMVHPDDASLFEHRKKLVLAGEKVESEFRIITNDGKTKWLHDVVQPEYSEQEKRIVRVVGSLKDITKSKLAEQEVVKSEKFFRNITENIPGLIMKFQLNADGTEKLLFLSKSVEELFEVPHAKALENIELLWQRIYSEDLSQLKLELKTSAEQQTIIENEYRLILPDGREKWIWAKGIPGQPIENRIAFDLLLIEVTDRKMAEKALAISEEKLQEAQRIAKTGSFEWNIKTNELKWSDNLFVLYGLEKQTPDFQLVEKLIYPDDYEYWQKSVNEALEKKQPLEIDFRMQKSDGKVIWVHNYSKLELDENGEPWKLIGITHDITERKIAEEALKESEYLFRTLNEASPIAIGLYDTNGILVYNNPAALSIMGAENREDLLGYDMFSDPFLTGENKERLRKGENVEYESQINFDYYPPDLQAKLNNKGTIYLHVVITPLGEELINGYLVQMQDVTSKIKAQIKIKESQQRLSLITNSVDSVIFMLKVEDENNFRFEFINDYFFKATGYNKLEYEGKYLHEVTSPQYFKQEVHHYRNTVLTGKPQTWETESPFPKGIKVGLVNLVPIMEGKNRCSHLLGVVTDITDRSHAEKAIKESEERYKQLSELTFEGIVIHTNGIVEMVNKSFCKIMGYEEEEIIGKDIIKKVVVPEDKDIIYDKIQSKVTVPYELRGRKKDGTVFPVEIEAKSFQVNGQWKRVAAIRDITQRKQAQWELKKRENQLRELNTTKDKLLFIIGHDLRNPFVQLVELSNFLEQSLADNNLDEVKMYASVIKMLSDKGHTLLMNLLEWSRNQTGRLKQDIVAFDLNYTLQEVINMMTPTASTKEVIINYHAKPYKVLADQNMVKTVLRNLIGNAIKFSYKQKSIDISVKSEKGMAVVSVQDQGIGMKNKNLGSLFDLSKNFTTKGTENEKGSGLGLIICKEFVEKNNGKIWAESEYGKGSTFNFTLILA